MITEKYDKQLKGIINQYFPGMNKEEIEEHNGFFQELIDGTPKNVDPVSINNYPIYEMDFSDNINPNSKVFYYAHLFDRDNVFRKVSDDGEVYFSILEDDFELITYNKERSYYRGCHVWEKDSTKELYEIVSMFIKLYGIDKLEHIKKLIRKNTYIHHVN